jgi:hypothetical protein
VDRRLKKALKTAISATFRHARRDYQMQSSIRKSFRAKQIGPVMGVLGRSESFLGIGEPKLPRRFPPRVQDLELKSSSQISPPREGAAVI